MLRNIAKILLPASQVLCVIATPSTENWPPVGESNPSSRSTVVVLPQPVGPTRPTVDSGVMTKSRSRKAGATVSSY